MSIAQLARIAISPLSTAFKKHWLQATVNSYYRDMEVIDKQIANDMHAKRLITREIVLLESELNRF